MTGTPAGTPRDPVIAVTLGDVRGIGPEIIEKALADVTVRTSARFLLVGPSGTQLTVDERVGEWRPGGSAVTAGALAGRSIERAVELAAVGTVQGIVTAPLDKAALLAGDSQAAVTALRHTIEVDPKNASAHYQLSRALDKLGQKEEAQQERQRFAELKKAQPQSGGMATARSQ